MNQPRYQIFISSTFQDLQEERQAVLNAILKLNQFPAGMEIFPAADDTPWEMIERIIAESDYYLLIIGGKYGSLDETGISYTEKEYDFALSQNVPVLPFIHSNPENIALSKSESKLKIRKKLESFKEKVSKHHCKYWNSVDDLKSEVLASLSISFITKPRSGWIKADGIKKGELLDRFATLQGKYDDLLNENNRLKETAVLLNLDDFVQEDDPISIEFEFGGEVKSIQLTCNQIIGRIGKSFFVPCETHLVEFYLGSFIVECLVDDGTGEKQSKNEYARVLPDSFHMIEVQMQILGLIKVGNIVKQSTRRDIFTQAIDPAVKSEILKTWEFKEKGKNLYLAQKALRIIK